MLKIIHENHLMHHIYEAALYMCTKSGFAVGPIETAAPVSACAYIWAWFPRLVACEPNSLADRTRLELAAAPISRVLINCFMVVGWGGAGLSTHTMLPLVEFSIKQLNLITTSSAEVYTSLGYKINNWKRAHVSEQTEEVRVLLSRARCAGVDAVTAAAAAVSTLRSHIVPTSP